MNVYLAARFSRQAEIVGYARQLRGIGYTVTSRWLSEGEDHRWPDEGDEAFAMRLASEDMIDLEAADIVIVFTDERRSEPCKSGGMHFEAGYAAGRGIPLVVIGPVENVFYSLVPRRYESWDAFVESWSRSPEAMRVSDV